MSSSSLEADESQANGAQNMRLRTNTGCTGACCLVKESESHSVVSSSATPWTAAYQALLSMGFSRQEYWSGLPFPSPGDLLNTGMEPWSLAS